MRGLTTVGVSQVSQVLIPRRPNYTVQMDAITIFGMFAVTAMLVCYALEQRAPVWILCFAASCLASSAYGFLQGAWPFGLVEAIWTGVAVRRWRATTRPAWRGSDAPIACDTAAFSLEERQLYHALRRDVLAAVTAVAETSSGFSLTLSSTVTTTAIAEWLALERRCCPFLELTLHLGRAPVARVDLQGGPGTKEFLRGEFPSFP